MTALHLASRVGGLIALFIALPRTASSSPCDPAGSISTCVDAEGLQLPGGDSSFVGLPEARTPRSGRVVVGVATTYAYRPLVLNVASPDPEGRDIELVKDLATTSLAWSYAPRDWLEALLVLPFTPYQRGSGPNALASQTGAALPRTAVRDPRLGAAFALPSPLPELDARALVELALPLGDPDRFARSPSATFSPGLALGSRQGRLELGSFLGLRLREAARLESARVGSELVGMVGVAAQVLERERLSVALEAHLRSTLLTQPGGATLAPAEWLLSVRSVPSAHERLVLQLGGGTALPLSSGERDGETTHFAGATAPALRGVLGVRYVAD